MGCCGGKRQLPGFTTRLANFSKAMVNWSLHGFPTVTEEVYQRRLSICQNNTCGMLVDDTYCSHPSCGCPVARKAAIATEACPLALWPAETENVSPPTAPIPTPPRRPVVASRPKEPLPITEAQKTCLHGSYVVHGAFNGETVTIRVLCRKCKLPMSFVEPVTTSEARLTFMAPDALQSAGESDA